MPPAVELTEEQMTSLSEGLTEATKQLTETRAEMEKRNAAVDKLMKEREKEVDENSAAMKKIKEDLKGHAEALEKLAAEHTHAVEVSRAQMKLIGSATETSDRAWVASNGVIFESKQQALELGMFFLATMGYDHDGRTRARKWIAQQGQSLRYLPQIPKCLVNELGATWLESMRKSMRTSDPTSVLAEDIATRTTPGSVLAFPSFVATLIRNVEQYGTFRQSATIWPMAAETVWIPRRKGGSGLTIYWVDEGGAPTETDPDFELLQMTAKKMGGLHQYAKEMDEDSAIAYAAILMFEFALAIAMEEDRIGFNGTGTGGQSPGFAGYTGVLGAAANATVATADATGVPLLVTGAATNDLTTEITAAKLRSMTGLLHTWARAGAKWYMHRTVHADLDSIVTGSGHPVVIYPQGASPIIMGYPVVDTETMPVSPSAQNTKVLALGDLRKSWILGDRRAVEIKTSEHFAFTTDKLTVAMFARIAFLMQQGNGMVVYKTGTTS